jgi:hypothetical protein
MFPSGTAGNGLVRKNSARDGSGQGRGGSKRIGKCQQCGFPNDFRRIDTSGGDLTGNGSRGPVTVTTNTGTLLNGETFTDSYGDATNRKGAGCAVCGSKNAARNRPSAFQSGTRRLGPGQ